ncbi:MAG: hypothetical protein MZV64_62405 [Ignavibacteriales bacterium]|nr:hypothetical protein [Ignavibacteriales bacterium]
MRTGNFTLGDFSLFVYLPAKHGRPDHLRAACCRRATSSSMSRSSACTA